MAMTKCPECGQDISDQATVCPHCGYPIKEKAMAEVAATLSGKTAAEAEAEAVPAAAAVSTAATSVVSGKVEAYDVMLVDYGETRASTISDLVSFLGITASEATAIVDALPCYLYEDIQKADAERIARLLQNCNMRIAVYDPVGNVRYFEPARYTAQPIPVIVPIPRLRRWIEPHEPIFCGMPRRAPEPMWGGNRHETGGGMRQGGMGGGPGQGGGHGGPMGGGRPGR